MGKSFHVVRPLEPPLLEVEDRVMFIPRGQELVVEKDEARVLLICEGRMRLEVDGAALGEVGPGDILIVMGPCRQVYRPPLNRALMRIHLFRIVFDSSQFTLDPKTGWPVPLGSRHEETDFVVFIQNHFARLRHLVKCQTPAMQAQIDAIRRDAEGETSGFRHRVSARARLLVMLVGERLAGLDAKMPLRVEQSRNLWICEQAKEYLLTHANEALTLQDVARHLRLSAEHVARVFKQEEGRTLFDFVRELRIERAKALLTSAQLSIHEIAGEVGYSSATLFCRNFKRATGITPATYRGNGGGQQSFSGSTVRPAEAQGARFFR